MLTSPTPLLPPIAPKIQKCSEEREEEEGEVEVREKEGRLAVANREETEEEEIEEEEEEEVSGEQRRREGIVGLAGGVGRGAAVASHLMMKM